MPTLSYGLNVPQKAQKGHQRNPAARSKAIFDDLSEEENEGDAPEAIETFDSSSIGQKISAKKDSKPDSRPKRAQQDTRYGDLSSAHKAAKHAAEAQEVDPSVYDYDGVYDSIHSKPAKKTVSTGPKYMQKLLESAEVRKRDQLRAKEKMLAKEREAEGEEFADKERFVTEAYRAQQEEMKRLEEEERQKEEQAAERRKREGGGMQSLYRDMLAREDARHEAINEALQEGTEKSQDEEGEADDLKLAKKKGAVINEDGQVVDKRQLLTAGLNLSSKPKSTTQPTKTQAVGYSNSMNILSGRGGAKAAMRERQTRMVEEQLELQAKRAAEEETAQQEAISRAAKSRKTDGEISSARERYLQRKREAEAAKAAGQQS